MMLRGLKYYIAIHGLLKGTYRYFKDRRDIRRKILKLMRERDELRRLYDKQFAKFIDRTGESSSLKRDATPQTDCAWKEPNE